MSGEKRAASASFGSAQLVKRQKSSVDLNGAGALTTKNGSGSGGAVVHWANGDSGIQAQVMELSGHSGEIFCARFDPSGHNIASGSMDRTILLWRSNGDCANTGMLSGHKSAVLDLQWSRDGQIVYSASADAQIASWNVGTGERIRRHVGHEEVINSLDVSRRGEEFVVSGSDDGSIGIWDPRQKLAIDYIQTDMPVTAVCLAEAGNEVYSGAINNEINVWDLRMKKIVYILQGHDDTVTSLALSPDSQSLLSNSHDSTVRIWDARPFAPTNRQIRTLDGAQAGLEKNLIRTSWDSEGKRVAAGGGDGTVTVWENGSGRMLHKLPGHKGTVNDARISPDGSLILTASTDRTMLLGQLPR